MQHLDALGNPGYDPDGFKPEAGRMRLFGGGGGKKPKVPPAPELPPPVQYMKDAMITAFDKLRMQRRRGQQQASTLLVAPAAGSSGAQDFASVAGPRAVGGTLLVPVDTGGKLV